MTCFWLPGLSMIGLPACAMVLKRCLLYYYLFIFKHQLSCTWFEMQNFVKSTSMCFMLVPGMKRGLNCDGAFGACHWVTVERLSVAPCDRSIAHQAPGKLLNVRVRVRVRTFPHHPIINTFHPLPPRPIDDCILRCLSSDLTTSSGSWTRPRQPRRTSWDGPTRASGLSMAALVAPSAAR